MGPPLRHASPRLAAAAYEDGFREGSVARRCAWTPISTTSDRSHSIMKGRSSVLNDIRQGAARGVDGRYAGRRGRGAKRGGRPRGAGRQRAPLLLAPGRAGAGGSSQAGPGFGIRYPTPRSLMIQVGFAGSSPSLRRIFLTKSRTGAVSPLSPLLQTWRSRDA